MGFVGDIEIAVRLDIDRCPGLAGVRSDEVGLWCGSHVVGGVAGEWLVWVIWVVIVIVGDEMLSTVVGVVDWLE